MKNLVRLMCVCMALMLGFAGMPVAEARTAEGFIRVDGQKLVDENGKEYQIRATQFMSGWTKYGPTLETAKKDHDEESYQELREMGFNANRYAICIEYFETDAGWEWMDQNVAWAREYGIRLIPTLHVFEGVISDDVGQRYWSDANVRQKYIDFWQTFAERYADDPYILGYDLCNEPQIWVAGGSEADAQVLWKENVEEMIAAIREVDDNHMIFVEGVYTIVDTNTQYRYWHEDLDTPHQFLVSDDNVVYEFHSYYPSAFTGQDLDWAGTGGKFMSYPGYSIDLSHYDWAEGTGEGTYYGGSDAPTEWTTMWRKYTAADDLYVGEAILRAENLNADAKVYFDNYVIEEYDADGCLIGTFFSEGFDSANLPYTIYGGQVVYDATDGTNGCIVFSNTDTSNAQSIILGHFTMTPGHQYMLKVDVKCSGMTNGFITTNINQFKKKADGSSYIDKEALRKSLLANLAFGIEHNVPTFWGEFGTVGASTENNRGGDRWIIDTLSLCHEYDVNYSYWCYHAKWSGIWEGSEFEERTDLNQIKWDALTIGNELNTELEVLTSCAERMDESTALIELDNTKKTTVYAAVVEAGADKPTIDTSGEGIAVGANGDSFTLAIGEGEQDIYLVLKDAQGNKLNLMFEVEAWRQPAEITGISITPESLNLVAGERRALEAEVSGTGAYDASVVWSVNGQNSASTRMEENTLIIGRDETAVSVTVTAEAAGNPAFTATAEVTVLPRSVTTMPDDLVSIDSEAFEGAAFQAVVLGSNVTGIGGRAFANCAQLIDIVIPETVITIAYDAFDGCRSDLVIRGTAGSPAEAFADQQGYIFEILP